MHHELAFHPRDSNCEHHQVKMTSEMLAKSFALVLFLASLVSCQIPNCDEVDLMKEDIKNLFKRSSLLHPGALRLGKSWTLLTVFVDPETLALDLIPANLVSLLVKM